MKKVILIILLLSVINIASASENNISIEMHYLDQVSYTESLYINFDAPLYWKIAQPRAFFINNDVYINQEAYFFDKRDYNLVIDHEIEHIRTKKGNEGHAIVGIMSDNAILRYFTVDI